MVRNLMMIVGLTLPITAIAAPPYCLSVPGLSRQCIYVDGAACAREATRQNGTCEINESEIRLPPMSRVGSYCLVMPNGASRCGYGDGTACSRDALAQKGACVKVDPLAPPLPNDYQPNAGR